MSVTGNSLKPVSKITLGPIPFRLNKKGKPTKPKATGKGKTGNKRPDMGSGFSRVINPSRGNPEPFPPKQNKTFVFTAEGYIPLGNARFNYLMSVPGNGLYEPGSGNTNAASTTLASNLSVITGSSALATAQPWGYSYYTNMYRYYHVLRSRVKVTTFSSSTSDPFQLAVFPATEVSASLAGYSGTSGSVSPAGGSAASMPFGKAIMCTPYSDVNGKFGSTISLGISTARVNGVPERSVKDDVVNNVAIGANPSLAAGSQDLDLPWSWFISICDCGNVNFAGNIFVKVEVEYDTVMTEPNSAIL